MEKMSKSSTKKILLVLLMCSVFAVGGFTSHFVNTQETVTMKSVEVPKFNITNVLEEKEIVCVNVEPQTIIIKGLPYTRATPNHKTPCSLIHGGGFE
jgi:hypothetical protein